MERLQKIISRAGICSRREAEEFIRRGKVTVNGKVITTLGAKADPSKDAIRVGAKHVAKLSRHTTLVFMKPAGLNCAEDLKEILPRRLQKLRLRAVGRLDSDSQGLLLLTNDGELLFQLTQGSVKVVGRYEVKIRGLLPPKAQQRLERGFVVSQGFRTQPARVKTLKTLEHSSWIDIETMEGKSRQLRVMFDDLHILVSKMKRSEFAGIRMGSMRPGQLRLLAPGELKKLYSTAGLPIPSIF